MIDLDISEFKLEHNSQSGPCESLDKITGEDGVEKYVPCPDTGIRRIDNGSPCGIHCDRHYYPMVHECRQRSW